MNMITLLALTLTLLVAVKVTSARHAVGHAPAPKDKCCLKTNDKLPFCCLGITGAPYCTDHSHCPLGDCTDLCSEHPPDECCLTLDEDKPYCCDGFQGENYCSDSTVCTPGDCSDKCNHRPPDDCCLELDEEKPFCCAGAASILCVADPACTPAPDCSDLCSTVRTCLQLHTLHRESIVSQYIEQCENVLPSFLGAFDCSYNL